MRVLLSPDSFKGSSSAADAARALATGLDSGGVAVDARCVPLSDGGEGLVEVLGTTRGGARRTCTVTGALSGSVVAEYLVLGDGTAIVESASALGLALVAPDELDPFAASSRGLGELLAHVGREPDVSAVLVGLGGVSTVDGGAGLREVLPALSWPTTLASDVVSPLLGERGAAAVFGPQKGASPRDVQLLEARLARLDIPAEIARRPGAGAAGGLGAMLMSMGALLASGVETVLARTGWHAELAAADIVVTGEGTVDLSSLEGKVVSGVLAAATAAGVPTVVIGGRVHADAARALRDRGAAAVVALEGSPPTVHTDLARCAAAMLPDLLATTGSPREPQR